MEWLGIVFEIFFLLLGIYLYLFARGFVANKNQNKELIEFRKNNQSWMRWAGLGLIAIMLVNLSLRIFAPL